MDLLGKVGRVGLEDLGLGIGLPDDTFAVQTYSGAVRILRKLPHPDADKTSITKGIWYVGAHDLADHGDAAEEGSLAWVIAQAGTDPTVVVLSPGQTFPVLKSLTVPSTVTLVVGTGVDVQVADTKTLAINGPVLALGSSWHSGDGTVTITNTASVATLSKLILNLLTVAALTATALTATTANVTTLNVSGTATIDTLVISALSIAVMQCSIDKSDGYVYTGELQVGGRDINDLIRDRAFEMALMNGARGFAGYSS